MNMANMSTLMKKPNTPIERSVNQRKYSLVRGFSCQLAKVPVKTMMALSRSMATEMPSTPTLYLMFRAGNQSKLAV